RPIRLAVEGAFVMAATGRDAVIREASRGRLPHWLGLLYGPQTLGRGPGFWIGFALSVLAAAAYPLLSDGGTGGNPAYLFTLIFMARVRCLIWGYAGAGSVGQAAFFGLSGYAHGVITVKFGAVHALTRAAVLLSVGLSSAVAALLGYF